MQLGPGAIILAASLVACHGDAPPVYHFDGRALGDPVAAFLATPPYATACRGTPSDAAPGVTRFEGTDCFQRPGTAFPDATSVALVGDPVRAIAWFQGDHFIVHSDFPAAVGAPEATVVARLGPVERTFDVVQHYVHFHARRHRGGAYSFVDRGVVVGYAVGELPTDPSDPLWKAMTNLYMMAPQSAALTAVANTLEACQAAMLGAFGLLHPTGKDALDPALRDRVFHAIDACTFDRTKPFVACMDTATTAAAVRLCDALPTW